MLTRSCALVTSSLSLLAVGCLPYTAANTASIVPRGVTEVSASYYRVSAEPSPSDSLNLVPSEFIDPWGWGVEARFRGRETHDLGIRFIGLAGLHLSHKYRVLGSNAAGVAVMTGVGTTAINLMMDLTVVSSREYTHGGVYGGMRAMKSVPYGGSFDPRALGGFVGVRVMPRGLGLGIGAEGAWYDHVSREYNKRSAMLVPSVYMIVRERPRPARP